MRKIMLAAGLILAAGCYTMEVNMKLNSDDSGVATFVIDLPYSPPEEGPDTTTEALRQSMKGMADGKKGAKLLKYSEEISEDSSTITMTAKYRFKDFNEFFAGQEESYSFDLQSDGKMRTLVCKFTQDSLAPTDLPENASAEDSSAAALAELTNMFLSSAVFNLIVEVDGKTISHNADSVKQGKIYWSVPFYADTPEVKTFTLKYKVK